MYSGVVSGKTYVVVERTRKRFKLKHVSPFPPLFSPLLITSQVVQPIIVSLIDIDEEVWLFFTCWVVTRRGEKRGEKREETMWGESK